MIHPQTIIAKADSYLAKENHRAIKDTFLETYSKCEILCRDIVRDYLINIGEYTSDEDIGMDLKQINNAMSEAGYSFTDKKVLTRIWGKSDKKGSSSCRFLRNKITHELMERALHEVVERETELMNDMNSFMVELMNNGK